MQFGSSYCSPKVAYHLRCSKKTGVNFSGFYGSLSYVIEKGSKKGVKKGVKRTRKRETVNDPINRQRWLGIEGRSRAGLGEEFGCDVLVWVGFNLEHGAVNE
jgi:hypothetical protein